MLAQYQSVNSQAAQTAQTPFQTYGTSGTAVAPDYSTGNTGTFVAPVNSEQTTGIANTNTAANEAQPYYDAATGVLGATQNATTGVNNAAEAQTAANSNGLSGAQINQYLSPYLGDVLGSTEALTAQQNEQAQSGALGTAISSGAFGGDRTGIAAANLQQQEDLAAGNVYSGIANQGYQSALSTAQQEQQLGLSGAQQLANIGSTAYGEGANTSSALAGLGSGAQSAALQGANAQIAAGTVEQQTQQAQDTAQYNQFEQQQSYPFQVDQFLANIAEGTGALSGSTTTTQQPGGFFSDKRLKHDIKKVGKTYDGQDIYSYKMHGDPRTHIGLIAQNVEKKHPEAVGLAAGYKTVDYGKATDEAANRGHFYAGGLARAAYAGGGPSIVSPGDLSAILQAQQQMYAPYSNGAGVYGTTSSMPHGGSARVPPPSGGVAHLVTAQGGVREQPTGMQNVSNVLGLASKGNDFYNDVKPKPPKQTTSYSTPSMPAAADSGYFTVNGNDSGTSNPGLGNRRGGRIHKDDGGDVDGGLGDVLNAQDSMYQNRSGQQRNIPSTEQQHQLAVASGTPAPPPSGSSQVQQTLSIANDAHKVYNWAKPKPTPSNNAPTDPNNPSTLVGPPQDAPQGLSGGSAADTSYLDSSTPALESSAPEAATDTAAPAAADIVTTAGGDAAGSALAGSGEGAIMAGGTDAAGAAVGDAAGTAIAGAATDAAGTTAVDLAAEYALADVAAGAVMTAKRGGLIRPKYDTGGIPYSSASAGSPYSDTGGLNIPDDENSAKLQTAGPIQKIPTGLQDITTMGNPNNWGSTVSSVFSNEAEARGGLVGRRGYGAGGDPNDPTDPDGPPLPDPNADDALTGPPRTSGLGAAAASTPRSKANATADPDVTPAMTPKPKSGGLSGVKNWWEANKGYVLPAVSGLAAMGTAPTRSLGVALASGLGAAANSYVPTQQGIADTQYTKAETTGKDIENQIAALKAGVAKQAIGQLNQPRKVSPVAPPQPVPDAAMQTAQNIEQGYRDQFAVKPYVGDEQPRLDALSRADAALGTHYADGEEKARQRRMTDDQFKNTMRAQQLFDAFRDQATSDPDPVNRATALIHYNALKQFTNDEFVDGVDKRTGKAQLGTLSDILTPAQQQEVRERGIKEANEMVVQGSGLPQKRYTLVTDPSTGRPFATDEDYATHVTGVPPFGAAAPQSGGAPMPARTPVRSSAPDRDRSPPLTDAPASSYGGLPGFDVDSIPKLPPLPVATDQPSLARATKRADADVQLQNEAMERFRDQQTQAQHNAAIYAQLEDKLKDADPRAFGPSSHTYKALANLLTYLRSVPPEGLVDMHEADKYLVQLGVGGSRQLLGSETPPRQEELLTLMAHGNPNLDQPLQVIRNLAAFGKAGNAFDDQSAASGIEAIRRGADPIRVPGAVGKRRSEFIEEHLRGPEDRTFNGKTWHYDPDNGPRSDQRSWRLKQ